MPSTKRSHLYVLSLILLLSFLASSKAQSVTDGATPLGLTPGMPSGSYALSDFDAVNLYNGNLGFRLPLLSIAGRGNTGYAMTLRLEQKWVVDKEVNPGEPTMYYPNANWWTLDGFKPNYSVGRLETRQGGSKEFNLQCGLGYIHVWTLTRLTFTAPDGTEYELRDQLTNGRPDHPICSALNRGRTFVTSDGTSATFVSDADVTDYLYDNPANTPQSGYLMLRDGTRYRIDGGKVTWMRDRNGNKLTFTYNINQRPTSITDSLNRQVTITYGSLGGYDEIAYKGFGGATRSIKIHLTNLQYVLRSDYSLLTYQQLFPELNALATQTYGNSLIHAISYNNRLQPNEIKLGTSGAPTSIIDLVYSYGTTNNNGNVQSIAYNGGGLSYTQTFGYDALNRLTTAQENSGANWSQTNCYDRYGNRWIDLGGGNQSLYFTTSNNRITAASYDNAGNLLNDGYHSYAYDAENKISKVNGTSAYVYDGNGLRVRKLVGENLRFIYGIGGQLLAEYSGSTGALTKEYVYSGTGLVATIEPTVVNSNGTRYATSDHLGSPRVITNASAGVVSRHDYMPFGEEIGSGVGGRTVGMGFGVTEGLRKKFTSHERDAETGLDYMQARFYSSGQGRFSSSDPLLASGESRNPQSWNRYAYVLNNPVRLIDPNGLDDAEATDSQDKKQVVNPLEDKAINKRLDEIREKAKPLATGETPKPTTVEVIPGEQTILQNATIDLPEPDLDMEIDNGYMQTIALVVLDQGGNIMVDPNLSVTESAKPDNQDAKDLYGDNRALTTNAVAISQQANGVFYDLQVRQFDPNKRLMDVQTKQDAVVKSGTTNLFMVQGTQIRMNDANRRITYMPGSVRKFGN